MSTEMIVSYHFNPIGVACRVGPIISHSNDGDDEKRQLMLIDYKSLVEKRLNINWDGWLLTSCVNEDEKLKDIHN